MAISYRAVAASPALPDAGLRLAAPTRIELRQATPHLLAGCFRIAASELAEFEGPPHRAVTLVVRDPSPRLLSLGHDELLFVDDVQADGDACVGHFALDLMEEGLLARRPGRVWVSASMLGHRSDAIAIDVVEGAEP